MIKVENIEVWGFEHAIRGMRNPMGSHHLSDSGYVPVICEDEDLPEYPEYEFKIGKNDLGLMRRLYKAGTEHRKYARQIYVSMDITAPLYWWKEYDTYKVGTTANSYSTMHKIHAKEFTMDDFSCEHLDKEGKKLLHQKICYLNKNREKFIETGDKQYWWNMIQSLESSYNQKRTVTMTYENVFAMIHQRTGHKLDEWREGLVTVLRDLPYVEDIIAE